MELIKAEQALAYALAGDRLRIYDGEREIYTGYACLLPKETLEEIKDRDVKDLRYHLDISHRQWKERELLPPVEPNETPDYKFSDLQVSVYNCIHL